MALPSTLGVLVLGIVVVTAALMLAGIRATINATEPPLTDRRPLVAGLSLALVGWPVAIIAMGLVQRLPAAPVLAAAAVVVGVALFLVVPRLRAVLLAVPPQWIVGVQAYRLTGAVFLVLGLQQKISTLYGMVTGVGDMTIGPIPYIIFAVIAIVGASNGVNLTDGLDGLAGGTLAFAFISYLMIALLNVPAQPNLALVCAITVGAIVGFLWFNVHPAQLFMGDTGSLSLGATIGVIALMTGQWALLPIIAVIPVSEALSDIIQIAYFKMTHGRRFFKMAPIHLHFELLGWSEMQIVQRFWLIGLIGAMLGIGLMLV